MPRGSPTLQQELEELLAYFKRRGSFFCARSMRAAEQEATAPTAEARTACLRNMHYDEGAGESFNEAGERLEGLLKKHLPPRVSTGAFQSPVA